MDSLDNTNTIKFVLLIGVAAWVFAKTDITTAIAALATLWIVMPYAPTVIYVRDGEDVDE